MMRQLLQPVIRNTRSGVRSYHVPKELQPATLDEALVPSGSWQESYKKHIQKYNLQFAAGVLIFIGTVAFGRVSGLLWFNYTAPVPKKAD